jgi:hypothetical protein
MTKAKASGVLLLCGCVVMMLTTGCPSRAQINGYALTASYLRQSEEVLSGAYRGQVACEEPLTIVPVNQCSMEARTDRVRIWRVEGCGSSSLYVRHIPDEPLLLGPELEFALLPFTQGVDTCNFLGILLQEIRDSNTVATTHGAWEPVEGALDEKVAGLDDLYPWLDGASFEVWREGDGVGRFTCVRVVRGNVFHMLECIQDGAEATMRLCSCAVP